MVTYENEYLAEHILGCRCNISFLVCALFSTKLMKLTKRKERVVASLRIQQTEARFFGGSL